MTAWVRVGSLLVDNGTRLLVVVSAVHNDSVTVEYDDDGSTQEYSLDQVINEFRPWKEGEEVHDRTGKGRLMNPGHPAYRPKK